MQDNPFVSSYVCPKVFKVRFFKVNENNKFWVKMLKGGEWEQICAKAKFRLIPSQRDCPILLYSLDPEQNVMRKAGSMQQVYLHEKWRGKSILLHRNI